MQKGVWNYNPTTFDPTQAYTNPIYAMLSILPAWLGINVVVFFKLLSIGTALALIFYFLKKRPQSEIYLALFFAVPATMVHLVSGLETFLFVVLMFWLFVAIQRNATKMAVITTLLLFITRPESWLLVVLVPLFLSVTFTEDKPKLSWFRLSNYKINWVKLLQITAIVGLFLSAYFLIHFYFFGNPLPNTFFVKSGKALSKSRLVFLLFALTPLVPIALMRNKRIVTFGMLFFIPVILNYATSKLTMDYLSRYAFHIYAPLALLVIFLLAKPENYEYLANKLRLWKVSRAALPMVAIVSAVGFIFTTYSFSATLSISTYYPRLLASHGALGDLANLQRQENTVHGMAISDAGLAAYRAEIPNLDFLKLGTHIGATKGISKELLEKYNVDFAVVNKNKAVSDVLVPYLHETGSAFICDVYFRPNYVMELWALNESPHANKVCKQSKKLNDKQDLDYLSQDVKNPPWSYWH